MSRPEPPLARLVLCAARAFLQREEDSMADRGRRTISAGREERAQRHKAEKQSGRQWVGSEGLARGRLRMTREAANGPWRLHLFDMTSYPAAFASNYSSSIEKIKRDEPHLL